jgi:glutamate 5-kinase
MHYKRIVAKFGTNLLTAGTDSLDKAMMSDLVDQVARLHKAGHEIVIVTSGAVAAGKKKLNLDRDSKAIPMKQVLSSLGQGRLIYMYEQLFEQHGINVAQALLTKTDLTSRAGYLNARNTLLGLIELGVICIINENDVVATDELAGARFGDNDNLSAMVATLVDADLLILLSDIEGLYTADPHNNPDARLISRVEKIDAKIQRLAGGSTSQAGTGGMTTKIQAARLATSCGTAVVIANGFKSGNLYKIASGEDVGTVFDPANDKLDSRQRWIVSGLASKGKLTIDDGAVKALKNRNKSLLAAGILDLDGKFQRGDVVDISDKDGNKLGCGISNYNAREVAAIKGVHSSGIHSVLGYDYGSEVVHRNNMALI